MTIDALIMFSGAFVTLLPFLGFPLRLDNVILVILGIFVIALGIIVRRRGLKYPSAIHKGTGAYVESTPREVAEPISRSTPAESDA